MHWKTHIYYWIYVCIIWYHVWDFFLCYLIYIKFRPYPPIASFSNKEKQKSLSYFLDKIWSHCDPVNLSIYKSMWSFFGVARKTSLLLKFKWAFPRAHLPQPKASRKTTLHPGFCSTITGGPDGDRRPSSKPYKSWNAFFYSLGRLYNFVLVSGCF